MATTTAFILVGRSHRWAGGLTPMHVLRLTENSRPAWVYSRWPDPDADGEGAGTPGTVVWIPSHPDRILADGLLMAGVHAVADPEVRKAFAVAAGEGWDRRRVELDSRRGDFTAADRVLDGADTNAAVAVFALQGSSVSAQLHRLESLDWDVEVAVTSYGRSPREDGTVLTWGALPGLEA